MKTCKTCSKPFDPVQSTELVGPYLGGSESNECPSCTEDAIYELARKSRSHLSVERGRIYWNEVAASPELLPTQLTKEK